MCSIVSCTSVRRRKDKGIDGADTDAVAASGAPGGSNHRQWRCAKARREANGELGAGVATRLAVDPELGEAGVRDADARFAMRSPCQKGSSGCRHVWSLALTVRRPRRPVGLLVHPDGESPTTHNANGYHWPDENSQDNEHQQFRGSPPDDNRIGLRARQRLGPPFAANPLSHLLRTY